MKEQNMGIKTYMSIVLLFASVLPCSSQSSGFLKEGKVWNCFRKMYWDRSGYPMNPILCPFAVTLCTMATHANS